MDSCPCCLEQLRRGFALDARRRAGACEICGERACSSCLRSITLPAQTFRARASQGAPSERKVQGLACTGCLWELLTKRGVPPPFPEPAGHRRKAAQAACDHAQRVRWMRCCPDCGAAVGWQTDPDAPVCDACNAPAHELFNACWSCGESFEEANSPDGAPPELDRPCSERGCGGRVAWPMPHCPWCAGVQAWPHTQGEAALTCLRCDASIDPSWAHCIGCGAEAPLPERCIECGEPLDQADCAARCEACKHMVCGACFGTFSVSGADGEVPEELLLCITCAEELEAEPVEELGGRDGSDPGPDAPDEPEPAEAAPDPEPEEPGSPSDDAPPATAPTEAGESAWEVLGVAPGLPLSEVRRAYLRLVSQYHPDKVAQLGPKLQALALEETRRLNEAWSALSERHGNG